MRQLHRLLRGWLREWRASDWAGLAVAAIILGLAGLWALPGENRPVGSVAIRDAGTQLEVGIEPFGAPPSAPQVGDILFATLNGWSGNPTSYSYQWQDCDTGGANCVTATGIPSNTSRYVIAAGDVGFRIRVAVTASYSGHPSSTVQSAATGIVGGGSGNPVNTAAPVITDATHAARFGYADTLTTTNGTWTVSGITTACGPSTGMVCAYQWQRSADGGSTWSNITTGDCRVVCLATYRVQTADIGDVLRVIVTAGTASGGAGHNTDAASSATTNAAARACNQTVSTAAALETAYETAAAGSVICLTSGTYAWDPVATRATGENLLIQPAPSASVTFSDITTNPANNFTVAGVTFSPANDLTMEHATHDITVYDSAMNNYVLMYTDNFNNSNIVIDDDVWNDTTQCTAGGRVWTNYFSTNTTNNVGITVSNSYFNGGCTVDILPQAGAGMQIIANEFVGKNNTLNEVIHSDTIFNSGDQGGDVMMWNWFHDAVDVPACGWAQNDGTPSGNTFADNVVSHAGGYTGTDGCTTSVVVGADLNSTLSHNVLQYGTSSGGGSIGAPIGQILFGHKTGQPAGSGTVARDNIIDGFSNGTGGNNSPFSEDHNMCRSGCTGTPSNLGPSTGDITGTPTWQGGANPTSFVGFALAAGSTGIGAASDGMSPGLALPVAYAYPR